jgi:hypothetical protein
MGMVLGAAVGAIVASSFGPNKPVFGASIFILGFLSAAANSNRNAHRFAGVTLAIVQRQNCVHHQAQMTDIILF